MPELSIVIPTRNEQRRLGRALDRVEGVGGCEIVVADGGSDDGTPALAASRGAVVVSASRGRGPQLNAGAERARGDVLLFLHADTLLPPRFDEHVRDVLSCPGVVAGAFRLRIDGEQRAYRRIERWVQWRSEVHQWPYGDQALFMTAATFHETGGYPPIPAMEDYELVRTLRRRGRIAIAAAEVVTSARRWSEHGVWRTTALNQACVLAHRLGVSPYRIARWRLDRRERGRADRRLEASGQRVRSAPGG